MATNLTKLQWEEILKNVNLTYQLDIDIFQTLFSFEKHKAHASQLGKILGKSHGELNLRVGKFAKRIAKQYEVGFTQRADGTLKRWDFFFIDNDERERGIWQLKPEIVDAMISADLSGEVRLAEEIAQQPGTRLYEGAKHTITVNSYERNPLARKRCIEQCGAICSVCNFDFEKMYGEIGKGFIHVHHLTRVAEIDETYEIDPITDLRPVCPNCHAMLHRKDPPLTIEELKKQITKDDKK